MNIREKLSTIQADFKAKKSRKNNFGNYMFRSAEDILEALKPYNKTQKVYFTIDENLTLGDFPIMHSTATIVDTESGDQITASAIVGIDLNQKGMQMSQKFGSASSYGKKYALGNLLLIDDTADSDATNTHDKSAQRQTLKAQAVNVVTSQKPVVDMNNIDQAKKFLANGGLLKTLQEK
ncbi:MAG: ERF family protein, partial [Candidatus Pelagibacterales bacterium]